MKYHHIAIFAAAASVASAKPHQRISRHAHAHVGRMAHPDHALYAPAPVSTAIVYELDGRLVSEEDARQGIANGTLRWGDDGILSSSSRSPVALPTTSPAPPTEVKESVQKQPTTTQVQQVKTQAPASSTKETTTAAAPASSTPAPSQQSASLTPDVSPDYPYDFVDNVGNCASCDKIFSNGLIIFSKLQFD